MTVEKVNVFDLIASMREIFKSWDFFKKKFSGRRIFIASATSLNAIIGLISFNLSGFYATGIDNAAFPSHLIFLCAQSYKILFKKPLAEPHQKQHGPFTFILHHVTLSIHIWPTNKFEIKSRLDWIFKFWYQSHFIFNQSLPD